MERDKCVGTQSYKQRERRHDDADIIELTDDREKVRKDIDRPEQIGASDDRDRLDHRWHGWLSNQPEREPRLVQQRPQKYGLHEPRPGRAAMLSTLPRPNRPSITMVAA